MASASHWPTRVSLVQFGQLTGANGWPDYLEPWLRERIRIPEPLRIGHDAAFAEFTRRFLADVADPASRSARERPNLLAKYFVTTESVALSRG